MEEKDYTKCIFWYNCDGYYYYVYEDDEEDTIYCATELDSVPRYRYRLISGYLNNKELIKFKHNFFVLLRIYKYNFCAITKSILVYS